MASVEQGHTPQHGITAPLPSAEKWPSPPATDDFTLLASEVEVFLRQRFPQHRFDVIGRSDHVIIQAVTGPVAMDATRPAPSDDPAWHLAPTTGETSAAPTAPEEVTLDCAACINAFLEQSSAQGPDCYTPLSIFLDALQQWSRATGQAPFAEEDILSTLMEGWTVYQGAREGWILDEYRVTYQFEPPSQGTADSQLPD